MFNKFVLFFCVYLATFFSSPLNAAGILGSLTQSNLASEVKATGTTDYVIDLNVRIDIPDQYRRDKDENPVMMIGDISGKIEGVYALGHAGET